MNQDSLDHKRIKKILNQTLEQRETKNKYSLSPSQFHTHNGTDSTRISESSLLRGNVIYGFLTDTNTTGSPVTSTVSILNVANLKRLSFHGFAANNASGPATERAVINGEVNFGRSYKVVGIGSVSIDSNTQGVPFAQSYNYIYIGTVIGNVSAGASATDAFAYASNGTNDLVSVLVTTYSDNSITISSTVRQGWAVYGSLTLTS